MAIIITAYKIQHVNPMTGEIFAISHWYGDLAFSNVQAAVARMETLATYRPVAAVFYETTWLQGGRPKYVIDKTDKSGAPIRGLEGLLDSLPSNYF